MRMTPAELAALVQKHLGRPLHLRQDARLVGLIHAVEAYHIRQREDSHGSQARQDPAD